MNEWRKLVFTLVASAGVAILAGLSGCEDEPQAPLVGSWQGQTAEAEIEAFGFVVWEETYDPFEVDVTFNEDGSATVNNNGTEAEGTWERHGDKLITTVDLGNAELGEINEMTIKELTETKLVLTIKKDTTFQDPDSGLEVDGTIKGVARFNRVP